MKKGFTLIELLGILVILGLVVTISLPTLTRTLKNNSIEEYNQVIQNIEIAAENYFEGHREQFSVLNEVGGIATVSLQQLIDAGYMRSPIKNPKTKKEFPTNYTVIARTNTNHTVQYEFREQDSTVMGYVRDKLVLQYDGWDNAGIGAHDNQTTIWKDLSGLGHDGVLNSYKDNTSSYWNYNSLNMDGVNDSVLTGLKPQSSLGSSFTISTVIEASKVDSGRTILGGYTTASQTGISIHFTNSVLQVGYGSGSEMVTVSNDTTSNSLFLNKKVALTVTFSPNQIAIYLNGILQGRISVSNRGSIQHDKVFVIGRDSDTVGHYFQGKSYSVRVYNKLLTESEMKQNYEIDKARFEL